MILAFQTSTLGGGSCGVLTWIHAVSFLPGPCLALCLRPHAAPRHSQGSCIPHPKLSVYAKSGFLEGGNGLFIGHKIFLGLSLKRKKNLSKDVPSEWSYVSNLDPLISFRERMPRLSLVRGVPWSWELCRLGLESTVTIWNDSSAESLVFRWDRLTAHPEQLPVTCTEQGGIFHPKYTQTTSQ